MKKKHKKIIKTTLLVLLALVLGIITLGSSIPWGLVPSPIPTSLTILLINILLTGIPIIKYYKTKNKEKFWKRFAIIYVIYIVLTILLMKFYFGFWHSGV